MFIRIIISNLTAELDVLITHMKGAGAGALSTVICCPLDVAKVRIQVQGKIGILKYSATNTISAVSTIAKEEGMRGLYKGLGPALLTVPLFWSMYWCTYNRVKEVLVEEFPHTPVVFIHVSAAITAGAIGDVITNPLWVTRTRIQTLIFHNDSALASNITTIGMIRSIYKNEGIRAFYKGLGASFLGLSHVAVQFPLYEYLKKMARDRGGGDEESVSLLSFHCFLKFYPSTLSIDNFLFTHIWCLFSRPQPRL